VTGGASPAPPGLVYVDDTLPGLRRVARADGFDYFLPDGRRLRDKGQLERIRRLAIPPAYTDVWICPLHNGHLQATGRDARGRKQYRYHAEWRESRDADKFARMLEFGRALPKVRARVRADLALPPGQAPRRRAVLGALVRLLDTTLVRVGNDEYARANRSYGLTTLRNRHAAVRGSTLRLSFRGKGGIEHKVDVDDPRVARIVRRCQALPGQHLFEYEDEDGSVRRVDSADVNEYLREASDAAFTAKDFRTWHATVHALALAREALPDGSRRDARQVLAEVASLLRNTVAVCRKSYVHPQVLALCGADSIEVRVATSARGGHGLRAPERALLAFLRRLQRGAGESLSDKLERSLRQVSRRKPSAVRAAGASRASAERPAGR
jgi:DNA topoisomerase-1